MAVVAGDALVAIGTTLFTVFLIGLRLVAVRVTAQTGIDRVVRRIVVAVRAIAPFAAMLPGIDREEIGIVVEGGTEPSRRPMADLAIGAEARRNVRWIGRAVVVALVATEATSTKTRVDLTDVAIHTGRGQMGSVEQKHGGRVIKSPAYPGDRAVTDFAGVRESGRRVAGIDCRGKLRLMTGVAVRAGSGVLPADMARRALYGQMSPRQSEVGQTVIEHRARPGRRAMTELTLMW